jgi:hypothetical protein
MPTYLFGGELLLLGVCPLGMISGLGVLGPCLEAPR